MTVTVVSKITGHSGKAIFSTDLRCQVIIQYMNGGFTLRSLARLKQISKLTVHRWVHQSNLAKERCVARKIISAIVKPVRTRLQHDPFATYAQLKALLLAEHAASISVGSIHTFKRAGFVRKRVHKVTNTPDIEAQRDEHARHRSTAKTVLSQNSSCGYGFRHFHRRVVNLDMKPLYAYSRSEKAMETMVRRIVPNGVETLVVYGAADFAHAMKGTVATPYRKLRDRVKGRGNVTFVPVGECNTSQKCCQCHRAMGNVVGEKFRSERVCRVRLHAVKVCPNCSTTWNRDTNAARNIRTIFLALREGRERPVAFRRLGAEDNVEGGQRPQPRLVKAPAGCL